MKRLTISMWGLAIFFYLSVNAISQIIYNDVGHIPQPDQLDWTNAGRLPGTPTIADVVFNVDSYTGSDNAKVQLALASAKSAAGTAIVYFPARTYTLTSPIVLDYSIDGTNGNNIVFQGAGSDATILNFTIGKNNSCFKILGQLTGSPTTLNANVVKGSKNISASSFSGYATGNWIRLCEPNNPYVYEDWAKADKVVGQITQLEAVGSTTATMKDEASKLYSTSYGTWIQRVLPIENVGIENLKIKRMDGDEATVDGEGSNIQFSYAVNCWIKGVESEYTCRHHVAVRFSSQIEVSGCYFYNAASYDIGGRGYGVLLECSSTNCLIENNIFRHLRHAMLIQAGANCNVVTYNYSKDQYWKAYGLPNPAEGADLSLHGNYPYANLIEQNYVARIIADDYHGDNGPYNAFVRNYAYDDQGDKWGYISLHNAPNSSALGCEVSGTLYNGGVIGHGSTTWSVEFYGIYVDPNDPNHDTYETGIIYTHYLIFMQPGVRPNTFLADVSYYYSSVPDFIYSSPCSFPSIGPSTTTRLF